MKKYLIITTCCFLCALFFSPALAEQNIQLLCPDKTEIGQPFYIKVTSPAPLEQITLKWLNKTATLDLAALPEGGVQAIAVLSAGLERSPGRMTLEITAESGGKSKKLKRTITILKKEYPTQRLSVDNKFVALSPEAMKRHEIERKVVQKALTTVSRQKLWQYPLLKPVEGRVSSAFGLKRVYNGKAANAHGGLDLAAAEGAPVLAMADGVVLLAVDHYFSGQAVFLDHGQGLISMYMHLSKISVQEGDMVRQGQEVGLIGKTGRVTGPHLHFGINILGERTDPLALLNLPCP